MAAELNYSEIKNSLKTGDAIFFHGGETTDDEIYALELVRGLPFYSHVGIVFRFQDSDPSEDPLFWQAAPPVYGEEYGNDYIKLVLADGCQLVNLTTVLNWAAVPTQENGFNPTTFAYRPIQPALTSELLTQMENFMRLICGRSFSYPDSGPMAVAGMGLDYAEGLLGHQSANTTFFCSKLASATYQAAGLLPSTLITNSILPGNIASSDFSMLDGYSLGDIQPFLVTVAPPVIE